MNYQTPELLAPAGSLEKLKVAILYGANAVYAGGQNFGLRSAADNFTNEELLEGVKFAHDRNAKVYVVLNSFLHDKDILDLPEFLYYLEEIKVDAVIVSDLGVIETIKKHTNLEIHLSTQASCLNIYSAKLWKKMGVKRIVLGREVSIKDAARIKKEVDIEVELFIHGSMCMAYSGNCVISNYTQGRDSNRGGCAHSCRFEYNLDFTNIKETTVEQKKSYFMSSKDLEGVRAIQEFIDGGIDSLKVEGRMKAHHYVSTISNVYSQALKYYQEHGNFLSNDLISWEDELKKINQRDRTLASLITPAEADSIYDQRENDSHEYSVAGVILEVKENEHILMEVRKAFHYGDELELIPFSDKTLAFSGECNDIYEDKIDKTRPGLLVKLPYIKNARQYNIVRSRAANEVN